MRLLLIIPFVLLLSCTNQPQSLANAGETAQDSVPKERFTVLSFMMQNDKASILIDRTYRQFTRKAEFPISLFITVNTEEKDQDGFPTPKEAAAFKIIADETITSLTPFKTCYIGQTTVNGYRDLIFYIRKEDQPAISNLLTALRKKHARIRTFTFEEDPKWEAVGEFYEALK